MSKEQTPITAEELYISIADVLGRHWEVDVENTEKCVQIAEQYANAKVLEALEREVIEAHTQGQAFVIKQDNLKHGRYPIASIGYYENEVKPKYE
jgi:hypothetical protein